MAPPITARFGKFRILLGNTATPIVFSAPCGFTSKSLKFDKALSEVKIPDCDDPDAPINIERDIESFSVSVSGEGVLASSAVITWLTAYEKTTSVPVKVEIEFSTGTVTWTGKMHVESLEIGAAVGERTTINVSLQSDGALVRTSTIV